MIRSQDVPEEQLSAFLDGELDASTAAQIEAALLQDAALAARVARQRQLRELLRSSFDPVLHEPVPERLLRAVNAAPASVTDIQAARTRRVTAGARRWSWPEWGAVAATLVLGVTAGFTYRGAGDQPLTARADGLVASGYLAAALSNQLAGKAGSAGARIGLSIKAANGEYCRSFTLQDSTAGLACRRGEHWVIDTAQTAALAGQTEFRQAASSLPDAVRRAIEQRMSGEPLTEAEEVAQRETQWRATDSPR